MEDIMNCTLIGIAGGTASGKTTISKKIYELSQSIGSVVVIRMDDYYCDLSHLSLEERRKINYDHPSSYDSDLLIEHLQQLKQGKAIKRPTYDFVAHNRSSKTKVMGGKVILPVSNEITSRNKLDNNESYFTLTSSQVPKKVGSCGKIIL